MTKEQKQEFTLRITTANETDLVVILYEMTLEYLEDAKEAGAKKDYDAYHENIRKVRGCLNELLQSLHMEYEVALSLYRLYMFCIRRLANAEVRKKEEVLDEIITVIAPLKEAYKEIAAQNTSPSIMQNTQTVYTGMTYGKNSLAENLADQSPNRGMLV
jgi:flagellar protein FliS